MGYPLYVLLLPYSVNYPLPAGEEVLRLPPSAIAFEIWYEPCEGLPRGH